MSYNINNADTIVCDARIDAKVLRKLWQGGDNADLPECNWINDLMDTDPEPDADGMIRLHDLSWYGEGSGWSFDTLKEICKHIKGHIEVVYTWEGGDSMGALIVRDGVVEEADVQRRIISKKKKKKK